MQYDPNILDADEEKAGDGRLSVADLVRMFEESEDATQDARGKAERDRDYVDNKQWTAEEEAILSKRGQPIVTDNRIKPKIDFVVGLEKQQRIDPRALPRTPAHESDADGATQALRSVTDVENYDEKRSAVWRNMLVEGAGGMRVYVQPSRKHGAQEYDIKIDYVPWDRMFWDPCSSRPDFSDAAYLGIVVWQDYDNALAKYPNGKEALDATMASASASDTYDDKPKFSTWADKKRKRVRVCQIWIKREDKWHFAEFTKGGILKAGPSPYRTDAGESDCELFFQSAFISRNNDRYGYVREMISPQDEINKRRSKNLHAVNTKQVIFRRGAFKDINQLKIEAAKPDGVIEIDAAPEQPLNHDITFHTQTEMAEGNFKLLIEAQNSIDLKGPNATMLGDKTQGSAAASGKAIIASQQGGMISMGDLTDNLRHLDLRVFRAIWNRIRQFWTAERWVRITDDERNIKWVGVNMDPMKLQMLAQQNPNMYAHIKGSVGNVAALDCDIIIDQAPDNLTPQLEQFQALVELKKMDVKGEIPFRAVVEAIPNLKNRQAFLQQIDEAAQQQAQQQPAPPPELIKAQVDGEVKMANAKLDGDIKQRAAEIENEIALRKGAAEIIVARRKAEADIEIAERRAAMRHPAI